MIRKCVFSEDLFEVLAIEAPHVLASFIDGKLLTNVELTFAAESLGCSDDVALARTTLVSLLRHKSALVREGVVYGLAQLAQSTDVIRLIEDVALNDTSSGVRAAASAVISGLKTQ